MAGIASRMSRLTAKLYDYALTHGVLKYKDLHDIRDIKIDTSLWSQTGVIIPAMTQRITAIKL